MMMQRTANENAACERRICKRPDQPKINRITNNVSALHHCLLQGRCLLNSKVFAPG